MTSRLGRWMRHLLAAPVAVRKVFPPPVLEAITQAIAASEVAHTGEIRLAVEARLPWSYLRRNAPLRERATMLFGKLGVWDTEHNNGVLIYVCLADRGIEIVADRGIARHVSAREWAAIGTSLRERFRRDEYQAGTVAAIEAIGARLAEHFPAPAGAANPDELSNRPTLL